MRSPLIALAACTALAAAPAALAATPASAAACTAPELVNASVSPRTVVLGVDDPEGFVVTLNVRKHGCRVSSVDTDVFAPSGTTNSFGMDELETVDGVTTYDVGVRVNAGAVANVDAGAWRTGVYVSYAGQNTNDDGPEFQILRAAQLTTNATPEPVVKGKTLTVKGKLTRANWDTGKNAGYTKRSVALQFRPTGGSYRTVKTVTSGAGGALSTTVKANQDGCFRYVFPGSSTTAKVTSGGDCVDVR